MLKTTNPSPPSLPMLLSNVCSLDKKLDYIWLQQAARSQIRYCCIYVFTETWLNNSILISAIQLNGYMVFRVDGNALLCSKTRGGWNVFISAMNGTKTLSHANHCSALRETVTIRCRPFYLPLLRRHLTNWGIIKLELKNTQMGCWL